MKMVNQLTADQENAITDLIRDTLPHGSGIDAKWAITWFNKASLNGVWAVNSFHEMDENGIYAGWTDFSLKINLDTMKITLTGGGKHKDYLFETFDYWFSTVRVKLLRLMGVTPIPSEAANIIFNSLHSWRVEVMSDPRYRGHNQAWMTKISAMTNEISLYVERLKE